MSTPTQRGSTLTGVIIGLVVGLGVALAVALYVSKVPVPFVDKLPQRSAEQDAAEAHRRNRQSDRNIALSEAASFADWLMARTDLTELPQIISWLEGCKPRDVIAALRREAA